MSLGLYNIGDREMSIKHWWNDIDGKFLSLGLYSISDREMGIVHKWHDIDRGKLHYSEKN